MAMLLRGRNAVATRPADPPPAVEGHAWARDRSAPGADDGYELGAADVNEIVGQLRAAITALGGTLSTNTGEELATLLIDRLNEKLPIVGGLAALSDDDDFVRMTVAERTKLEALPNNYKGVHASLAALASAHPTGTAGDWAIITNGAGVAASTAIWDTDNTPAAWVDSEVAPTSIDWASVTGKPSTFTPSSHAHATSDITGLDAALAARALASRTITGGGLVTGGGDLSTNRTLTVTKASQAEAEAGSVDDKAMTPLRTKDAINTFAQPKLSAGAAVTASGTAIDFTGIPATARRITLVMQSLSGSGTSNLLLQGGAGSVETTGYAGSVTNHNGSAGTTFGAGFQLTQSIAAADQRSSIVTLIRLDGNVWVCSGLSQNQSGSTGDRFSGVKTFSGVLDRLRLTTVGGSDTFDGGTVNIIVE